MDRWSSGGAVGTIIVVLICAIVGLAALVDAPGRRAPSMSLTPWYVHLAQAEADADANDLTAATHHAREAYAAAMASRRSPGLVDVGRLYRRLGERTGLVEAANARARDCYLTALLRARAEGSVDGVLAATEAFLELGDQTLVQRGLAIAREVAARDVDPRASERIAMLGARAARAPAPSDPVAR
jgi:hypothetical protein